MREVSKQGGVGEAEKRKGCRWTAKMTRGGRRNKVSGG